MALPIGVTNQRLMAQTGVSQRDVMPRGYITNQGAQTGTPQQMTAMQQPQYGLSGTESALRQGLQGGLGALQTGVQGGLETLMMGNQMAQKQIGQGVSSLLSGQRQGLGAIKSAIGQGVDTLNPFVDPGVQSQQRQAALSGALGQEAQQQAMQGFMDSPGQQFLREQGMEAITNQAAATGGLGGGNVLKELQRFGTGLAAQDFQNQFNRLGQVTGQGLQAAGQIGQLRGQQAGLSSNLIGQTAQSIGQLRGQGAGISSALAGQGAGMQFNAGQGAANMFGQTGSQIGQARQQAGRDIAGQVGQGSSALSSLINQQGAGLSDIIGQGGSNLAGLLAGAGQGAAGQDQTLAQILSNLATGQGTQLAQLQGNIGGAQAAGQVGQSNAIGGLISGGLGALGAYLSDRRLKTNIQKKGQLKNGLNWYSWDWNGKLGMTGSDEGVIAQEVKEIMPDAVIMDESGYMKVNYSMVV